MTKLNTINKDILTVEKGIIVQQVNAVGKTGAGLSGAINTKYPMVKEHYLNKLELTPYYKLGEVIFTQVDNELWVASIVGQLNVGTWIVQTDFDALAKGLREVAEFAEEKQLEVFCPFYMSSSLAGGSTQQTKQETWAKVSELIESILPKATICKFG